MVFPDNVLLQLLHNDAAIYSRYADAYLEIWHSRSKSSEVGMTTVFMGRENFMHLVGVDSQTCTAFEFYEKCLSGDVKIEDCSPLHSWSNRSIRSALFPSLFDFSRSWLYRIGKKDLSTFKSEFDIAIGSDAGTVGYAAKYKNKKHIPTTLTDRPIAYYCSSPDKILAILKHDTKAKEKELIFEIKKGICNRIRPDTAP